MSGSLANPSAAAAGPVSKFHRSYSMGQGWGALAQQQHQHQQQQQLHQQQQQQPLAMAAMPLDGQPKVVYRRRNNSTSEGDGSLLMCYPSEHLRRLVPAKLLASVAVLHAATAAVTVAPNANDAQSGAGTGAGSKDQQQQQQQLEQNSALLHRPAMAFMTQKHELDRLRGAMRRSLRIAACRIYALQALNWLLRSVTQGVCLHDLMWWFVSSLAVGSVELVDGKYEEAEPALEHPVAYTQISGRFAHLITQSLHVLLQSVADLTLHLPLGSPLQRVAIQCFGIRFRQADHQFLHSSHVFGNISKILSKSDEQNDAMAVSNVAGGGGGGQEIHCDAEHNIATATASGSHQQLQLQPGAKVIYYTDLAGMFEVTVSSRPAMAESLTDNSTETFWESDEEDRNKCKIIEMSMTKLSYACKFVLVHIDNSRDIQVSLKFSFFTAKTRKPNVFLCCFLFAEQSAQRGILCWPIAGRHESHQVRGCGSEGLRVDWRQDQRRDVHPLSTGAAWTGEHVACQANQTARPACQLSAGSRQLFQCHWRGTLPVARTVAAATSAHAGATACSPARRAKSFTESALGVCAANSAANLRGGNTARVPADNGSGLWQTHQQCRQQRWSSNGSSGSGTHCGATG